MLTTNLPENMRQPSTEEAVSVIHAPESFASWVRLLPLRMILSRASVVDNLCQTSASSTAQQSPPSERTSPKANEEALADLNGSVEKVR